MPRPVLFALVLMLCNVAASEAPAMGSDHPAGKIAAGYNKAWPEGTIDLVNSLDRVGGYWVNQGDFFFYRGDAAALNAFLKGYGNLPETPLAVVLHAGSTPRTGPLGKEPTARYDWQLNVVRRGWGEAIDPRRPSAAPGYVATVHVWLGDAITLDRLDIPKHVEARSADEVGRFVDRHREGGTSK